MSSAGPAVTISQHLPWVNATLDYTEQLVEKIPEDMLDYRPADPAGQHMFSLAEIAMHLADERLEFARMLAGSNSREGFWTIASWETGGSGTAWDFREPASKQEILDSLRGARVGLEPWLSLPLSALHEPTDGTRASFDQNLAKLREQGTDTSRLELLGPPTINRVLHSLIVHESGHRGALQTLLRLQGVNARGPH